MGRPADLVIRGRIATLQGTVGLGWAEAVAIGGGRILAAGSAADLAGLIGRATRRWRLDDDVIVMPSITDAHLHLMDAALGAGEPDLTGLDLADLLRVVRHRDQQLAAVGDHEGWLLGHGWSFAALAGRPTRAQLDAAAPGRPVALWSHDHHTRWLNTRALRLAGLASPEDPPDGRIERDSAGEAAGILYEGAAGLVDAVIPSPDGERIAAAIAAYARRLAQLGVTSVHDPGGLAPEPGLHGGPTAYRTLASAAKLPLRVISSIREQQLGPAIETGFRSGRTLEGPVPGRYREGWLKVFSDGALGSRTAALLAPYEVDPAAGPPPVGPMGMRLRSPEQLAALAGRAARAGIASQVHAIGDAAVRAALDVLAAIPAPGGMRHRIEHAQLVDRDDLARFAAHGIAASVQPCHLLSDAEAAQRAWGARAAMAFPLGDLDGTRALMPFGTDAPVEPPDPWPGIAAAVTRRGPGWPMGASFHQRQAISLVRALRAACLDGPLSAGATDEGHLDVGARADLIIVPAGPLDRPADPDALGSVRPVATLLDGVVVHQAPEFDP